MDRSKVKERSLRLRASCEAPRAERLRGYFQGRPWPQRATEVRPHLVAGETSETSTTVAPSPARPAARRPKTTPQFVICNYRPPVAVAVAVKRTVFNSFCGQSKAELLSLSRGK